MRAYCAPRDAIDLGWRRLSGSSGGGGRGRPLAVQQAMLAEAVRVMAFTRIETPANQRIGYGVDRRLISQGGFADEILEQW